MERTIFISVLTLLVLVVCQSGAVSVEEDLTLSFKQKLILDDFKQLMKGRLPHKYMYDDIYLIRWLRARDFNLKEAETMLTQNLEWRKENRMDQVVAEPWRQDLRKDYKYYIGGEDKNGHPILYIDAGDWDFRKAVLAGQVPKIRHFIDSIFEEAYTHLRKLREEQGQNVTQGYLIFDMDGFNLIQTGCPRCIPLILGIVTTYENHYPGNLHKLVFANTPEFMQPILVLVKNLMSKSTKDILYIYGRSGQRAEGQSNLLEDINSDQIPPDIGGTRELPY